MRLPKRPAKLTSASALVTVFLLLCLALLGCSQLTSNSSSTYDNYFPLTSGRVITYEVTTNTPVDATNPKTTYEATVALETWDYLGKTVILGSIEVFQINVTSGGSTTANYWQADATGAYSYGDANNITYPPQVWIKYPLTNSASWEWTKGLVAEVATEEAITTPAGNFTCTRINYLPGVFYKSFAKDAGLICSYDGGFGLPGPTTSREVRSKNF
jgi:hypothetical protein